MPTEIDKKLCTGCGECIEVCPVNPCVYEIININKKKKCHIKNPEACIDCGACVMACPEGAIRKKI